MGRPIALSAINNPKNNYENFLLVISYWIGPWHGVIVADAVMRKGQHTAHLLFKRDYGNYAGIRYRVYPLLGSRCQKGPHELIGDKLSNKYGALDRRLRVPYFCRANTIALDGGRKE